MNTALITGVSGYLGSHLAKTLKLAGWNIVGIDRKFNSNKYVDLMHYGDVCHQSCLDNIFSKIHIDIVFHLAGRIEVCESIKRPIEFYHNNVNGTVNVLSVMKKYSVKNIVYSSTAGIYKASKKTISEMDEIEPFNNPYSGSKYCAEMAIRQSGLNYVIFRYFNLAGADPEGEFGECHEPETHLIPKMLQNLNTFQIYGKDYDTPDGTCIRDYVHVCDVAEAHLKVTDLFETENVNETINLGTGKGHSIFELLELVVKNTDAPVKFKIVNRRLGDPPQLVADINYAKKMLNYQPKHDIISIIKTAYAWQNKDD
jgi:UDP-glucose-4-epimerase GalE